MTFNFQPKCFLLLTGLWLGAFGFIAPAALANDQESDLVTSTFIDFPSTRALAKQINDAGQVVGEYRNEDLEWTVFRWQEGLWEDLGVPEAYANDMNNLGHIVGSYSVDENTRGAFLWIEQEEPSLISLQVPEPHVRSSAIAIAENGDIAGTFVDADNHYHYIIWSEDETHIFSGIDDAVTVTQFNESQQLIGNYSYDDFDQTGVLAEIINGTPILQNLSVPGVDDTYASSINDDGVIVGWARVPDKGRVAYSWKDGVPQALIIDDPPVSCIASDAQFVTNSGLIYGVCWLDNQTVKLVRWKVDGGSAEILGTIPEEPFPTQLFITYVSDQFIVVNSAWWFNPYFKAFMWTPEDGQFHNMCADEVAACVAPECNTESQCVGASLPNPYPSEPIIATVFTITRQKPLQIISSMINDLVNVYELLDARVAEGLLQKIRQADIKLSDESNPFQEDQACSQLAAFIEQVDALGQVVEGNAPNILTVIDPDTGVVLISPEILTELAEEMMQSCSS